MNVQKRKKRNEGSSSWFSVVSSPHTFFVCLGHATQLAGSYFLVGS